MPCHYANIPGTGLFVHLSPPDLLTSSPAKLLGITFFFFFCACTVCEAHDLYYFLFLFTTFLSPAADKMLFSASPAFPSVSPVFPTLPCCCGTCDSVRRGKSIGLGDPVIRLLCCTGIPRSSFPPPTLSDFAGAFGNSDRRKRIGYGNNYWASFLFLSLYFFLFLFFFLHFFWSVKA
ncbi:hypothetical protein B0T19DRAFT_227775 [Cercophora scortea]|uniref:Uncharacterized protein n=1 Tax=Cercophora scortea TaxID=314031 RepID=A0AAE0M9G9_9PEZI|nr:hypothetical protein B0T19DRAFT_227775 [Cercophora scortea]